MRQLVPGEQSSEGDTAEGEFSLRSNGHPSEQSGTLSVGEKLNYLHLVQLNKVKSRWKVSLHNASGLMPVFDNNPLIELC